MYTHSYQHPKESDTDFAKYLPLVTADARVILDIARHSVAGPEGEPDSAPEVTDDRIVFNGIQNEACEPFVYPTGPNSNRHRPSGTDFCKTGRRAYDPAVVACLMAIKHHLCDDIKLHTDAIPGDPLDEEQMALGVALYRTAFPDRAHQSWHQAFGK